MWGKISSKDDKPIDESNRFPVNTISSADAQSATIASAGTTSGVIDLGGNTLAALVIPASYDGGNLTLTASSTAGGTFAAVYDSTGSQVTITVGGASRVVSLIGSQLQAVASLRFIKLVAASTVGADRVIGMITKG